MSQSPQSIVVKKVYWEEEERKGNKLKMGEGRECGGGSACLRRLLQMRGNRPLERDNYACANSARPPPVRPQFQAGEHRERSVR
jgi:hypothetical protein